MNKDTNKRPVTGMLAHLLRLVTVALILAVVAINRDGRILGHELNPEKAQTAAEAETEAAEGETISTAPDGTVTINTATLAHDAIGYSGPTPLTITVKDNVVTNVEAQTNSESPDFFNRAFEYLAGKWTGQTTDDILAMGVDGVSGATMSSRALDTNMRRGLAEMKQQAEAAAEGSWTAAKTAALAVVALGCILPLFRRLRKYRTIWLCVNVVVLGLWGGTFLSHAQMVGLIANGTDIIASAAVLLMLAAAFIYPFFGKNNHYCNWMCPLGSLQELAGKVNKKHKWRLGPKAVRRLTLFDEVLWAVLTLLMLTGVWFEWMDYEPFSAFLFTVASPVVITVALVFVVISAFVPRPYCRFVCPTGCLFRMAQNGKEPGKTR